MAYKNLAQYPYGAVYFRKSSPPREDWERDYAQAQKDGMNTFRHWVMWESIEIAPGVYDWDDYDAQLELAAKYGIKTIIAECIHSAPEWAYREFDHARYQNSEGQKIFAHIRNSSATGGFAGLCLDNDDYRALAGNFLTELARRYKGHPGLGGYDIWNENNLFSSSYTRCYCPASHAEFHKWLKNKYGSLKNVAKAWRRFGMTEWSDVLVPHFLDVNQECFDYAEFNVQNADRLFRWRIDTIKAADPDAVITAHGVSTGSLDRRFGAADDAWLYAKSTDCYGYSGGGGMAFQGTGTKRWYKVMCADVTRAGSDGRPFWAAERTSGPSWQTVDSKYHVVLDEFGHPKNRDDSAPARVKPTGEDLRANDLAAMSAGVKGLLSCRWRGLIDGPLFGAMGYYANDGLPTDRSEAAALMAKWANDPANADLWLANPVQGDIGIINCPETQIFVQMLMKSTGPYINTLKGIYTAFMDQNVQPDFVSLEQLDRYTVLYLPCPVMLKHESVLRISEWVKAGGTLISDGLPGYFNGSGRVGTVQPNDGFDQVFGCRETDMDYSPMSIRHEQSTFSFKDESRIFNGFYTQSYRLTTGKAVGYFADGQIAAVEHDYGRGRTLLVGTVPGLSYAENPSHENLTFFTKVLQWAGVTQHVSCSSELLITRMHQHGDAAYLWVVNLHDKKVSAVIRLSDNWSNRKISAIRYGDQTVHEDASGIHVQIPARDGLVLQLMDH